MENQNLSSVIKKLVEQVSLKEISTRDFVQEMGTLYQKIDELIKEVKTKTTNNETINKNIEVIKTQLYQYEKEYVTPAIELSNKKQKLEDDNKEWQYEKKYILREHKLLKEILSSLTAQITVTASRFGGQNGGSTTYQESATKPALEEIKTGLSSEKENE